MLVFGIVQGLTVCNLTCGPLLILRLAGQGRGANEGLKLSLMFSLPRIIILTLLGAGLGALGYTASSMAELSRFPLLRSIVYLVIAFIMIVSGLRFVGVIGKKDENICSGGRPKIKDRLVMNLMKFAPRKGKAEGRSLMGIGILVSLICFVEASVASAFVAASLNMDASDIGTGVLFGTLTMLSYSVGLTIPLLLLGSGASEMGKRMNREDVRVVGGFLLILIGAALALFTLMRMF